VEEARLGETVKCPKCGREGKLSLHYVYAKGFKYTYLAVAHEAFYGGRKSTRRCSLKLLKKEPAKPSAKQVRLEAAAKPEQEEAARLKEENERLKAEVARLREENRQLREAIARVYEARIVQAGSYERMCVRKVAWRESKLPPEVRENGWSILKALAGEHSVDWVAVRMDAFEQLRGYLA
jgi:hypothetical protein